MNFVIILQPYPTAPYGFSLQPDCKYWFAVITQCGGHKSQTQLAQVLNQRHFELNIAPSL